MTNLIQPALALDLARRYAGEGLLHHVSIPPHLCRRVLASLRDVHARYLTIRVHDANGSHVRVEVFSTMPRQSPSFLALSPAEAVARMATWLRLRDPIDVEFPPGEARQRYDPDSTYLESRS